MRTVDIIRIEQGETGTFGVLRLDGQAACVTMEPPDRDNQTDVSCIPAGTYVCRRRNSPRFGDTFEVTDVPGRTHILFHQGNRLADTSGCVLLGSRFGTLHDERAVLDSARAFAGFMDSCADADAFKLVVADALRSTP